MRLMGISMLVKYVSIYSKFQVCLDYMIHRFFSTLGTCTFIILSFPRVDAGDSATQ